MNPISIFDSTLTLQGIIDDYEYLKWNFRYRKVDSFELVINRYKNNVDLLIVENVVALYIGGQYRAGIIESKELTLTEEGKISESYHITGRGLDGLLAERIALYGTDSGDGYDSQSGDGETLARHYVDVNCISSTDTDRNYSLLELETNQNKGASITCRARFQPLGELLEDISLASGIGWGVVLDTNTKKFKFRVYQGLDRSWENGVNSPVIFSPEFGNIKLLGYRYSRLNSKNVAYVGGQGVANLRTVQKVEKDGLSYTNIDRREYFVDARDLDTTDKLTQRGIERLAEVGVEEVIEMENLNSGPFEYAEDFNLGDIVTVKYPGITKADARAIEVIFEITPQDSLVNKLVIGRQYPDLISMIRDTNKNIYPEIRR